MRTKLILMLITLIYLSEGIYGMGQEHYNEITQFVASEQKAYNIPNVVVGITNADSTIYLRSFGNGKIDDLYMIGSNSKSFTALAILLLQQQGMIDIYKTVKTYLPWFAYDDINLSDKVLVKDLLYHTSGIPRELGMHEPSNETVIDTFYSRLLKKVPENCRIGSYEYSNLNYQLLGLVIEKSTNKNYAEFLKAAILSPLEMYHTFASQKESEENGLIPSKQYLLYFPLLPKDIDYDDHIVPSGFISSTAEDMCLFLRALMNAKDSSDFNIVNSDITNLLFKPGPAAGTHYAMGWEVRDWKEFVRYKHDGLTQSYASSMLIMPELDIGLIVMANINNSPATVEMADGIMRIMTEKEAVSYSRTGFYLRNSLPLFALWIIIILFIRIKQWANRKFPIGFNSKVWPNIWLLAGISFGLFWIIYFPIAFNTPLFAIVDYEPNSGYSLMILSIGIIVNTCIGYFNKLKQHKQKP